MVSTHADTDAHREPNINADGDLDADKHFSADSYIDVATAGVIYSDAGTHEYLHDTATHRDIGAYGYIESDVGAHGDRGISSDVHLNSHTDVRGSDSHD